MFTINNNNNNNDINDNEQVVSPGDKIYRGLYDFIPSDEGEMSLSEGNVIIVTNHDVMMMLMILIDCGG